MDRSLRQSLSENVSTSDLGLVRFLWLLFVFLGWLSDRYTLKSSSVECFGSVLFALVIFEREVRILETLVVLLLLNDYLCRGLLSHFINYLIPANS